MSRDITSELVSFRVIVPRYLIGQTLTEFSTRLEKQAALGTEKTARKIEESERFRLQVETENRRLGIGC